MFCRNVVARRVELRLLLIVACLFSSTLFIVRTASSQAQLPDEPRRTEVINGHEAVAGNVLVKFRSRTTPNALDQARQEVGADDVHRVGGTGVHLFHSSSKSTVALLAEMSARVDVLYAEPDYIVSADTVPDDPDFPNLWGLQNNGQSVQGASGVPGADIGVARAWDVTTGSANNVVAVVDTGIDYTHPDLAANVWSAPSSFTVTIGGQSITCAQGTHGFNAITMSCDPMDDHNHGTHVSGTIGALGNNSVGVVGVNQRASIIGLKFLNSGGGGTISDAVNAIEFAVQAKQVFAGTAGANVRVLSNSWGGGGFSQSLLDEIERASSNDMLFVAAAGNYSSNNDADPFYPASYNAPNMIAVSATDPNDQLASFSNYGVSTVHLGAPGVNILSTIRGASYGYYSGTSMATPHVSGAAALLLSRCTLDTTRLKSTLLDNVDFIPALASATITGGRLNVNNALTACNHPDFSISAGPAGQTVLVGTQTSFNVSVASYVGFNGDVNFSVSGLPAGATASFSPASVNTSGTSTMTVVTSNSTPLGTYSLTITGNGGGLQHSATVSLTVNNPNFALSATPSSQTVKRGAQTSYSINVAGSGGFNGVVTLSVSGLPAGATASFSPTSVNTSGSSVLTVGTSSNTQRGTYTLTVTCVGGSLRRTTTVSLTVSNK
ncbi:MAG: hypothetical protein AUG51_00235 [Acidobacteria bacterium 13_1_20CM_3_53_8]|nr:MAG: hypothetical protein AUG51_00235 [Acidobacteria bacterium 13_1_20CM_3_53_8]